MCFSLITRQDFCTMVNILFFENFHKGPYYTEFPAKVFFDLWSMLDLPARFPLLVFKTFFNFLLRTLWQVRSKVCPEYFINIQGQPNALFFMIWLKMTLKCTVHMKTRHFYNHKDPPFDMKHQLMSADHVPVLKIALR